MPQSLSQKYASAYTSPTGAGDSRPTALQIIEDENLTGKLTGKVILITGCSSGLGLSTARALATTGATLFLTTRNLRAARTELSDITNCALIALDLCSLTSVWDAAESIENKTDRLDILICTSDLKAISHQTTQDGFEMQFAANHLGHFFLFNLLKPLLLKSATPEHNSRVVMVSSTGHRGGEVNFGDYSFEKGEYTPWKGYAQSKTANIYMASSIERKYGSEGLHGISLTPGTIWSSLLRHVDREAKDAFWDNEKLVKLLQSPEQGSACIVWAAVGSELEGKGGMYLENLKEVGEHPDSDSDGLLPCVEGYARHAFDEKKEDRLWKDSLEMVELEDSD